MHIATIVPPQGFSALGASGSAYHMALGQELVRNDEYRRFYRRLVRNGHFVMVDNGAAEPESERVPFEDILQVALEIGVAEIVLPDILRDMRGTINATTNLGAPLVPPAMRCIIPQGNSWQEWKTCFHVLNSRLDGKFRTIGIAKHLERLPEGRSVALEFLRAEGYDQLYDIHMFGLWRKPLEEIRNVRESGVRVRGVDSGAAFAYAQNKEAINDERHYSLDWFRSADPVLAYHNIMTLVEVANARNIEQPRKQRAEGNHVY